MANHTVKPVVQSRRDNTEYFDLTTISKNKLFEIINKAEQRRPSLIQAWTEDPFIEQLQKKCNATILLPMRKKHMIVIYGGIENVTNTNRVLLKKYFEADVVIPNWNGQDEIEDDKKTLLLTEEQPPYLQPYNALSLDGAMRLVLEG